MKPMLVPYLGYLALKSEKIEAKPKTVPSIQLHSYFGTRDIPGFKEAAKRTRRSLNEKWSRSPNPNTIPTAAKPNVIRLEEGARDLGRVALACIVPSTLTELVRVLSIDMVQLNSMLVALKRKGILRESAGRFTFGLVADSPPSGSLSALRELRQAAALGWMPTASSSHDFDSNTNQYATIVEEVHPEGKKEVRNYLVLDLLRAPGAYPEVEQIKSGQLRYLFENVYGNPIDEACLFATVSLPQTNPAMRESDCPTRISETLGVLWSKVRNFGLINEDYKTTPSGERVVALLNGAPLSPFSYMETLERFLELPAPQIPEAEYKTEFMRVVYGGVLYSSLSRDCGLGIATGLMSKQEAVDFYLRSGGDKNFYNPKLLAQKLEIDLTAARNALSKSFLYGAAGITTASHPNMFTITRRVGA